MSGGRTAGRIQAFWLVGCEELGELILLLLFRRYAWQRVSPPTDMFSGTQESDHIWRQGLKRGDQVSTRC